jgi:hypothetical protein
LFASLQIPDGHDQSPEEVDYSEPNVGAVVPFEQYPFGLGDFQALADPIVQGSIQVPPHITPLPPQPELVPQVKYGGRANTRRGFNRVPPITFAVGDRVGILLQDALNERYEGLVDRDDGMFVGCGCTAISLRIQVCTSLVPIPLSTISWVSPNSGPGTHPGLAMYVIKAATPGKTRLRLRRFTHRLIQLTGRIREVP